MSLLDLSRSFLEKAKQVTEKRESKDTAGCSRSDGKESDTSLPADVLRVAKVLFDKACSQGIKVRALVLKVGRDDKGVAGEKVTLMTWPNSRGRSNEILHTPDVGDWLPRDSEKDRTDRRGVGGTFCCSSEVSANPVLRERICVDECCKQSNVGRKSGSAVRGACRKRESLCCEDCLLWWKKFQLKVSLSLTSLITSLTAQVKLGCSDSEGVTRSWVQAAADVQSSFSPDSL